jgi:DNA-binding GntR family transcriptional regulator
VADEILARIETGEYPEGTVLTTSEVTERYGVSHVPAKAALADLVARGAMVRPRPLAAARVAQQRPGSPAAAAEGQQTAQTGLHRRSEGPRA